MPFRATLRGPELEGSELIDRELTPHLRELRRSRVDYDDVGAELAALAKLDGARSPARWLSSIVLEI
jgi:hypothetical protein